MMKFDHIGVFVKDLNYGYDQLSKLIEIDRKSQVYADPLLHVLIQFCFDDSGVCYELVSPYGDNSPVDSVLKRQRIFI
jgi:methylmalonyl-CoA/ethylmalonyl-CoA epimerase